MKFRCYMREDGMWAAHMLDDKFDEPIGPEVVADDNEIAIFKLGVWYGAHMEKFARPLDEIIPVEN